MPKSTTTDEFAALMSEILRADSPQEAVALAASAEPAKPEAIEVPKPQPDQPRRDPVAKRLVDDPAAPFQGSVAVNGGYLQVKFGSKQSTFLWGDQLARLIEWAKVHGDAYLAKAKAAGLK